MSRIFFSLVAAAGFLFVSGANDAQAGFGCLSKLFGHGCCESSCCETTCCEPVCCEPAYEPACCEPTCCESSCCDSCCGHGLGLGKLFGWLHNLKGHGCGSSCCGGGYESSCCGGY